MIKTYQHTQIGYLIIVVLIISILFIQYLMSLYRPNWIPVTIQLIFVVCLLLFPTLTVTVDKEVMKIKFGIGIIRKKFLLKEIVSSQIVKNRWYYGWGIKLTPHRWLYNVSGLDAVEIKMKNGKQYRIGTDVPKALNDAIRKRL
jgi:hypothetical protein